MADGTLDFLREHKKIVILGEAGSGKTELAMNLAALIHQNTKESVRFFDMDQTKPMFRAQDAKDALRARGVTFDVPPENGDTPALPSGVIESLFDPYVWTILDVGGGQAGALCMGQFAQKLSDADALVFYTINSYRAFSDTPSHIQATMNAILACCRLDNIQIVSNPFLGAGTTARQFREGQEALQALLSPLQLHISLTAVPVWLWEAVRPQLLGAAVSIDPYLTHILTRSPLKS